MTDDDREDEPVDPVPGMMAELDQAMKTAPLMARLVKAQYNAYLAEGFTEKQALYLAGLAIRSSGASGE